MLFSSLWFWGLRQEIEIRAQGGRVTGGRVFPAGLRLTLARADEPVDLVLWLDPRYPRAECLKSRAEGGLPDPWSRLMGTELVAVRQPDGDRRLEFEFDSDRHTLHLDYHAFARPVACLRTGEADSTPIASLGPGQVRKVSVSKPFLLDLIAREEPPADSVDSLARDVRGLDPLWEAAVSGHLRRAGVSEPAPSLQAAWQFIRQQAEPLRTQPPQGYLVWIDDAAEMVSTTDLGDLLSEYRFELLPSLSDASSRLVFLHRKREEQRQKRRAHLAQAKDLQKKLKNRHEQLERDREDQLDHPRWQENADWLTARLGEVIQGQVEIRIPAESGERVVPLDPALKPHKQAGRWYQRARRLRRGLATTESRLQETQAQLTELSELIAAVDERLDDDDESARELWLRLATKIRRAPAQRTLRIPQKSHRFRRFVSPGGLAIWVGRNNQENDELTLHTAHKLDLWFHAQQTAGSHVVLRSHALKQPPAREDIVAAAAAAAYFSKARTSAKAPVIYTEARYVRKPRKALPGKVVVEREKSIMVAPEMPPPWEEDDEA